MGQPMGGQSANRLEVRVRGNANQLLDKYKVLARDAHQAGDRVATEYYLQHADHYFRVLNDSRIRQEEMRARRGVFDQYEDDVPGQDGDDGDGEDGMEGQDRGSDRGQDRPRNEQRNEQRGDQRQDREPRQERGNRQEQGTRAEQGGRAEQGNRQDQGNRAEQGNRRYEQRDRPERSDRAPEREPGDGDDRPRRWEQQDRRPERAQREEQAADHAGDAAERAPPERVAPVRAPRAPRVSAEASAQRISDGEAALVAFGGVPAREPALAAVAEDEAPKRRRGRPRKVEAEPVEG
jgi:hypothetical protein